MTTTWRIVDPWTKRAVSALCCMALSQDGNGNGGATWAAAAGRESTGRMAGRRRLSLQLQIAAPIGNEAVRQFRGT
ncbi:MAG: hypothetical protein M0Z28_08400, partial [Rhodospirillales bacterium]|nr:hypothetical protein [Rhodospirillales bacterium]